MQFNIHVPKFVNKYNNMYENICEFLSQYKEGVSIQKILKTGFYTFKIKDKIYKDALHIIEKNDLLIYK